MNVQEAKAELLQGFNTASGKYCCNLTKFASDYIDNKAFQYRKR